MFLKPTKIGQFGIFNQLLSTQNVNVARFARNVEWGFFYDLQTFKSPEEQYTVSWKLKKEKLVSYFPSLEGCWVVVVS